jgi:hypothetical protein
LQGSWVTSKNTTRICREAGFFQKTWHEIAGKLGLQKEARFLQKSGGKQGAIEHVIRKGGDAR